MPGDTTLPLNRSTPPAAGPVRPFDFPDVTSIPLPNGLGLRVARMSQVPLVTLNVVLNAGESVLADSVAGLGVLTGSSLEGGTAHRSGPELAEAFEDIGSGLSVQTGWDSTSLAVTCLAERKEEAMQLLAEALLAPTFPADEVERIRSQRLAAIEQRRMDPGSLADDTAADVFFSQTVPYHRPLAGTKESVEALGPAEIKDHWGNRFRPSGSGLVVVGDIETKEIEDLAVNFLGHWEGEAEPVTPFSSVPRTPAGKVVIVDRPGAVQSEIRIGQIGAPRSTPHFFPLQIFNSVLGGAFTSRLMLNLREEHGFTYGVRSRFSLRKQAGPFGISTAVATEVTAPAVREAMAELKGLIEDGPTSEEVTQSRDFIAGVFPLRLETTGQVAARISELMVYGLPPDFFSTYRDNIRAVTHDAAKRAAQAVLRPEELMVVVVGDAEQVRDPLEDLGLGPVEVVTLD